MCVSYRIREWHCSSVIVQINSHTLKILFNRKTKQWSKSVLHTPDFSGIEITPLPLIWCCSYTKTPLYTCFNLHIPAVCSWVKTLWAQNTWIIVKSLWIIKKQLFVTAVSHTGQIIRQDEPLICSVWIQNHRSWWDTINSCFYSDVHIMIKIEPNTDYYELWTLVLLIKHIKKFHLITVSVVPVSMWWRKFRFASTSTETDTDKIKLKCRDLL